MTAPGDPVCPHCGRTLPSADALQAHVVTYHSGRPSPPQCEICGEVFEAPSDLKAHHESVHRSGHL